MLGLRSYLDFRRQELHSLSHHYSRFSNNRRQPYAITANMDTQKMVLSIRPALQPFEYTPLVAPNQIRLLEVEPADNLDAPLHGAWKASSC